MARGITEADVFTACDALLLAGDRPTIERVRQKIGRGSPNTVSPMLDVWFKGLGGRLQDPAAFAPASDVPDPVLQAARNFWEVAQAQARHDFGERLAESLRPMQAEVSRAAQAESAAVADKEVERERTAALQEQLAEAAERLDAERLRHAATAAHVETALAQNADLNRRLEAAEARARDADDRARQDSEAAHARATGAERRAALEIDGERTARQRADKRADALEKRAESLQAESAAAAARHLDELSGARAMLELERLQSRTQHALAEAALVDARLARERAEAEAAAMRSAMDRFERVIAKRAVNKPQFKVAKGGRNTRVN